MKKVSLLAFLLATATAGITAASAETLVPGCPKAFQGFGLKGNIGFGTGRGHYKSHSRRTFAANAAGLPVPVTESFFSRNNVGVAGVDGGIGVDYTHRFCNWALGIAFDANWANAKGKNRHAHLIFSPGSPTVSRDFFSHQLRLRNSLQLYARAGYVICGQVMPFIGLGWDNSQWKQSARFASLNAFDVPVGPARIHRSKRINSLLWKLGVDFLATKHCILGFEYTGTGGGRLKRHGTFIAPQGISPSTGAVVPASTTTARASFRPQYNKFALTLKFIY